MKRVCMEPHKLAFPFSLGPKMCGAVYPSPEEDPEVIGFLMSCFNGDVGAIELWQKTGRSFSVTDKGGSTPLMSATLSKCDEAFRLVLQYTPDEGINKSFFDGHNALFYAALTGSKERVQALLERGAQVVRLYAKHLFPHTCTKNREIVELLGCRHVRAEGEYLSIARFWCTYRLSYEEAVSEFGQEKISWPEDRYRGIARALEEQESLGNTIEEELKEETNNVFFKWPETRAEIARALLGRPLLPNTVSHAVDIIEERVGFAPCKKFTRKLLQDMHLKTAAEILGDKETRIEILEYFRNNRPETVALAIEYVKEKYRCEVSEDHMRNFLRYCERRFGWGGPF